MNIVIISIIIVAIIFIIFTIIIVEMIIRFTKSIRKRITLTAIKAKADKDVLRQNKSYFTVSLKGLHLAISFLGLLRKTDLKACIIFIRKMINYKDND